MDESHLPRTLAVTAALYFGAVCLFSQGSPTFKVDVHVVNVLATVRDPSGKVINNLEKEDFVLLENGKRQEIQYFSRQSDLPLTLGLLVDTSMSQRRLIDNERKASYQFFDAVLRPEIDQAFVIKFDVEVELLEDFTNSRVSLQKALEKLELPQQGLPPVRQEWTRSSFGQVRPGGGRPQIPGGWQRGRRRDPPNGRVGNIGTLLYDAVFLASDELLRNKEGRKAIVLITDGMDLGSQVSERDAIEAAHRADTIIYTIRYFDAEGYGGGRRPAAGRGMDRESRSRDVLTALAQQTGGRFFEVNKKSTLAVIFAGIQEELRSQYYLGYTPADLVGTGYRSIELRTVKDKLEVVTRAGYYPRGRAVKN